MDIELKWKEQIKDMDDEDRYHEFIIRHKHYPNGLFNLTSNPMFYLYSRKQRIDAINIILRTDNVIKSNSIFYDKMNDVVFFQTKHNLQHRCDIMTKQVKVYNYFNTK